MIKTYIYRTPIITVCFSQCEHIYVTDPCIKKENVTHYQASLLGPYQSSFAT